MILVAQTKTNSMGWTFLEAILCIHCASREWAVTAKMKKWQMHHPTVKSLSEESKRKAKENETVWRKWMIMMCWIYWGEQKSSRVEKTPNKRTLSSFTVTLKQYSHLFAIIFHRVVRICISACIKLSLPLSRTVDNQVKLVIYRGFLKVCFVVN